MSTRVLPDPAGATTRAGPAPWATAASWSGANAALGVTAAGTTDSTPASTDSPCTIDVRRFERERCPGPAVDPRRGAVRQPDVGGPVRRRLGPLVEPGRLDRPPPHGGLGASVVRVRPHEEVQAVVPGLGVGGEPPRLDRERLRLAEALGVDGEGDDDRLARRPRRMETPDRVARCVQHRIVDRDDRGVGPGRGWWEPGVDDDPAAEDRWTGCWHDGQPIGRARLAGKLLAEPPELAAAAAQRRSPT